VAAPIDPRNETTVKAGSFASRIVSFRYANESSERKDSARYTEMTPVNCAFPNY